MAAELYASSADNEAEGPYPPISDYGLISDMHSCALVSKAGSIDWCCFPRFDSASVFGRILDWERGGYFQVRPEGLRRVTRRYLPNTNVLETTFEAETGTLVLTDFMPMRSASDPHEPHAAAPFHRVSRFAECTEGEVEVRVDCHPRFDYGGIVPHATVQDDYSGFAHGGSDSVTFYCSAPVGLVEGGFVAIQRLRAGEMLRTAVTYHQSLAHVRAEHLLDGDSRTHLNDTVEFWEQWSTRCTYEGAYGEAVMRSALTLKALSYAPSGAMVAAATTSLPEIIGGERNWDYRYTWVRDASFALWALSIVGLEREAHEFKEWIEWSTAGRARDLQLMYGVGGERRLPELELDHLQGYRRSSPVRIGNGASKQYQLDIYGELMDSAHLYRRIGGDVDAEYWELLQRVAAFVMDHWRDRDDGIWESRGGAQHHVFSKVMCWVALDRALKMAKALDLQGDIEAWRRVRTEIREDVLERGFNAERGTFVGTYDGDHLDGALLMLPLVGFIKADEPRMRATIEAIAEDLTSPMGFVHRYRDYEDGLNGDEGTFTICTFWLVDNLILLGELDRARELFERVLAHSNDLGLLSEEIGADGEMLGNFPQAFSHMGLINAAVQFQRAERRLRTVK